MVILVAPVSRFCFAAALGDFEPALRLNPPASEGGRYGCLCCTLGTASYSGLCAYTSKAAARPPHSKLGLRRLAWRWRVCCSWSCRRVGLVWCCCRGVRGSGLRACGGYLARSVSACGATCEGHQRDVAGALDGYAEPTLVARADSGHAARENLAALLHELREDVGAFVVDEVHLLDTELANFFLAEILALAAGASAGTAGSTGAAFATRAAVTAAGAVSATMTAGTALATRCAAGGLRLLLLLICHNCLPFPFASVDRGGQTFCEEGPRKSAAATVAFAARSVLRLAAARCLQLESGSKLPHSKIASWRRLLGLPGLELRVPVLAPALCGAGDGRRGLRAFALTFSGA